MWTAEGTHLPLNRGAGPMGLIWADSIFDLAESWIKLPFSFFDFPFHFDFLFLFTFFPFFLFPFWLCFPSYTLHVSEFRFHPFPLDCRAAVHNCVRNKLRLCPLTHLLARNRILFITFDSGVQLKRFKFPCEALVSLQNDINIDIVLTK